MAREWIFLECTKCGDRYYRTSKSNKKIGKLALKKFCRICKTHTKHRERKK